MSNARDLSNSIKKEAQELLKSTRLENLLEAFGKVELGGSYAYDLMVDRDLDFGVAVSAITPEIRTKIVSTFTAQSWAYSVNMTDRVNFEPLFHLGAPRGLYIGLTIPFPKERWNIDIWFIVANDLPPDEMSQLIAKATEEQKATMLEIKYELMKSGRKEKGVTSADVYKAVVEGRVSTTLEFLQLTD